MASAASYQDTEGNWVNPITYRSSTSPHPYAGPDLIPGVVLTSPALSESDLERADLTGALITDGSFHNADLSQADLTGAEFQFTDLSGAQLPSSLQDVTFIGTSLTGTTIPDFLSGVSFTDVDFASVGHFNPGYLIGTDLSGTIGLCDGPNTGLFSNSGSVPEMDESTNLSGLDLRPCTDFSGRFYLGGGGGTFDRAVLRNTTLHLAYNANCESGSGFCDEASWNFNSADLAHVTFAAGSRIYLRNSTATGLYAPFVDWFLQEFEPNENSSGGIYEPRGNQVTLSCITDTDFTDADLTGSRFGPNWRGCYDDPSSQSGYAEFSANFTRARLAGASFKYVISDFIDFTDAYMPGVDLTGAALRNAIFRGAVLSGSTFDNTDLRDADFSGADLSYTVFLGNIAGSPTYDENTSFANAYILMGGAPFDPDGASWVPFDPAKAGWKAAPEPGFAVGVSAGALAIAAARRRSLGLHRATG